MTTHGKTSMSVMEMGRMLGLKKTNSYWLVKKNYFETVILKGHMRVMVSSFEEWYQGQTHYKKVQVPTKETEEIDNGVDC